MEFLILVIDLLPLILLAGAVILMVSFLRAWNASQRSRQAQAEEQRRHHGGQMASGISATGLTTPRCRPSRTDWALNTHKRSRDQPKNCRSDTPTGSFPC